MKNLDSEGLADAVRAAYKGRFVLGKDLMVIRVAEATTWEESSPQERQ